MNQTYIHKNDQQLGPFDDSVILMSLSNGAFEYEDLCWRDGWEDWKPLGSIYPRPKAVSKTIATASPEVEKEKVIWSGRPNLLNYTSPIFFGIILLPLFGLGIAIFILTLKDYYTRKYTITNRKVMVEIGIWIKSSNQIRIQDIRSINVKKSGIPALFGIGTIEVSSAATDKAEVVLLGIKDADKVRDLISEIQA